jgi:riboflavin synthase
MFTGIITDTTAVIRQRKAAEGLYVTFARPAAWQDLVLGESIATDGVCLTLSKLTVREYECCLVPETLQVTSFGRRVPDRVNVERAMQLSDRLSGHLVQGHIDATGQVAAIDQAEGYRLSVKFDPSARKLLVLKGSITLNGVSLTIAALSRDSFTVALVPYTLEHTTLQTLAAGDTVNLEFDMIGKYVANLIEKGE